ncbi:isoprenyl transferase [Peptostreptococcaceae bacterium AGR-M142]
MKDNKLKHLAIIMDGNGRWAQKRFMPRTFGHKKGAETLREILMESKKLGIKYLTVYAFSTENWKRSDDEVSFLMNLLADYLKNEIKILHENNVRLNVVGDIDGLPTKVKTKLEEGIEKTKENSSITLSLALNYGARNDFVNAVKAISTQVKEGKIDLKDIDENMISKNLSTYKIPDPDLIIRTSGELRLSNFLLFECAYSEFYFTDVLWPDFNKSDLKKAVDSFYNRNRRFGSTK